ncbi:MAG: acyl-CoA reductase [Flavipsychrobacter sp.]
MISLNARLDLLDELEKYMLSDDLKWQEVKGRAAINNTWFTPTQIELATTNIATQFLQKDKLEAWVAQYKLPQTEKLIGIVMAGNIPLVGFHDFLCGFVCGHKLLLKLSSKDSVLISHLIHKLSEWEPQVLEQVRVSEMLKDCDAYIATGSNNTARYFEQYFAKYPHIIRKNRTSVALLTGRETEDELAKLADDVFTYFGLGCRNVTQICVPQGYDFTKLLEVFHRYDDYIQHSKYKNNYDYQLAVYLLNRVAYLTNGSILLVENALPFSAVSVLHYRYYDNKQELVKELETSDDIQCIVGNEFTPFGAAQSPALSDYADGVDTMAFLCGL